MQDVQVFHVGMQLPTIIPNADFRTEGDGGDQSLIVNRGAEILAQFPAGKWSAVIKMDAPEVTTSPSPTRISAKVYGGPQAAAHTYTPTCAGHHGINEACG